MPFLDSHNILLCQEERKNKKYKNDKSSLCQASNINQRYSFFHKYCYNFSKAMKKLIFTAFLSMAWLGEAGNGNVVIGNGNMVRGNNNFAQGNQNLQDGDRTKIIGSNNFNQGNDREIIGDNQYVSS